MNTQRKHTGHIRNDILLIASILLIAAGGIVYLFVFRNGGDAVKITVDGNVYGIYPLSAPQNVEIRTGENGENINNLAIRDGKADMEYASCPDGICVSHRPIFRSGESIVCLPNRVVVTIITDTNDTDAPDIVT